MREKFLLNQKQFSLRTLILFVTAASLLLGAWSIFVAPYRNQARSLAAVHRLEGGTRIVPADGPGWQRWLVETMLDEDTYVKVVGVDLSGRPVDDRALASLSGLKFLTDLNLDRTQITDAGTHTLLYFPNLSKLSLRFTGIADPTAQHLAKLPQPVTLYLTSTRVSDAAILDLAKLDSLSEIYIRWTNITDAGAEQLRQALPNCTVYSHSLVKEVAAKP